MSQQDLSSDAVIAQTDSIDIIATVLRFYRSVLRRKRVVIGCVSVSMLVGAVYYVAATRLYHSRAELIVLQAGGNVLDEQKGSVQNDLSRQMPNFERVLQSDRVLKEALKSLPNEHRIDFADVHPDRWLEKFRKRMSVATLRNTNVITVAFRSVDPETAFIVVDSLLDSYLAFMNSMHQDATQDLLQILSEEKGKAERELRSKESQLLELKAQTKVIFGSGDKPTNVLSERVIELNTAYVEAKKKAVKARAIWSAIENAIERGEDVQEFALQLNESLGTRLLEMHTGLGGQDAFTRAQIERELLNDQAEMRNKMETHGPNHPLVVELRDRIAIADRWLKTRHLQVAHELAEMSVRELGPRLISLARRQADLANHHVREIHRQYVEETEEALEIGNQLAQIQLLENEVEEMQKYYNILLEAIKEKSLSKDRGITAKPITPPSIDRRPVTPKLSVTGMLALLAGLVSGGLGVYILDMVDDRFHSPDDLRLTLNSPILAMIRKLPRLPAGEGLESLYPYAKPNSVESEAFRTLRTAIDFAPEQMRRLTISSTEPSDGKTTVMASLAVAFAQAGKRTLVIDGDMRRPGTTRLFGLTASEGLSNLLRDSRPIAESAIPRITETRLEKLHILPSGPRPGNPVELLTNERLAELIAWAETQYDQILIDAPPSLAVADVQVIGRLVDAAILTVRPDKNRRKMVIRAAEALTSLGCRMFGIVVNHVEASQGGDYSYGYGYGYGYGEGYGHDDSDRTDDEERLAA